MTVGFFNGLLLALGESINGPTDINTSGSSNTNIGTGTNSGTISIGNTNSAAVSIDCGIAGITVGATANAHTTTLGSSNSTSATTLQSGSGALNITSTNGALTINAGTGTLGIATDASANTVNIATGAAVKTLTIGSTNTTSATAIKSGSGNIALNSGLTVDSTGRTTNTVQPAFLAYKSANSANQTGAGATVTVIFDTVVTNQGTAYNNGTGTFTAPKTGTYQFNIFVRMSAVSGAMTQGVLSLNTTARAYQFTINAGNVATPSGAVAFQVSTLASMTAADTATVTIQLLNGAGNTAGINGSSDVITGFSGYLVC